MVFKRKKKEEVKEEESDEDLESEEQKLLERIKELEEREKLLKGETTAPQVPEKEIKPTEKILVVKEYPTQEVRRYKEEDGSIVNLITVEEALTQLMNQE